MRGGAGRWAGRCIGLTVVSGFATAAGAQQVQTGLIVSTGVSAESNPYNAASGDGAVAATAELRPQARFRAESTTLDLQGLAQFRQFFRRYGLEDNYSGNAFLTTRASDRMTLRASASASYSEGGFNNFGRPGLSPLIGSPADLSVGGATATTPPVVSVNDVALANQLPLLTDVTVLGIRTRTKSFQAGAGFDSQLSGRSQLSGDINVRSQRFKAGQLSDFDNGSVELRYSRTLNELTSVGLIGSADLTNYRGTRVGDTVTKSALVSLDRRFSGGWALSAAVGASFSDIRQLPGQPNTTLTALNIRGRFCNQAEYSRFCVAAQRSPQPAANGSVRVSNSIAADYSRRLTARDTVTLAGSYSRTERGRATLLNLPAADFANASIRYDRVLSERMTGYVNATGSKVFNSLVSRASNLGIAAGIQIRFGSLR